MSDTTAAKGFPVNLYEMPEPWYENRLTEHLHSQHIVAIRGTTGRLRHSAMVVDLD